MTWIPKIEDTQMNAIRMFTFAAAVLITAFLLRALAYYLMVPQHAVTGTSASTKATVD